MLALVGAHHILHVSRVRAVRVSVSVMLRSCFHSVFNVPSSSSFLLSFCQFHRHSLQLSFLVPLAHSFVFYSLAFFHLLSCVTSCLIPYDHLFVLSCLVSSSKFLTSSCLLPFPPCHFLTHFSLSPSCSDFLSCLPSLNNPAVNHGQYQVTLAGIFGFFFL